MGWNGQSPTAVSFSISWKDKVGDQTVEEFANDLRKETEAFVAGRIKERFAAEIEEGSLNFMCGEYDSYDK